MSSSSDACGLHYYTWKQNVVSFACHLELRTGMVETKNLTRLGEQPSSDLPLPKPYALGQEFLVMDMGACTRARSQLGPDPIDQARI